MDQVPEVIQYEIISYIYIDLCHLYVNKFWNQTIKDQSFQIFDNCKLNENGENTKKYVKDFQKNYFHLRHILGKRCVICKQKYHQSKFDECWGIFAHKNVFEIVY